MSRYDIVEAFCSTGGEWLCLNKIDNTRTGYPGKSNQGMKL